MKNLILAIFGAIIINISFAQDFIYKTDGTEIKAKVVEIGLNEVKYKKFENINGPNYIILKSDVFIIKYKNGSKDVFNKIEKLTNNKTEKITSNNKESVTIPKEYLYDIIIKTNGDTIKVKFVDIWAAEIKYKKFEYNKSTTYSILKSEVFMIIYKDGSREMFNNTYKENTNNKKESITVSNKFSHDIILKTNGDTIKAKVLEIWVAEIRYKKIEDIDGPEYSILKSKVSMIIYKDRTREVFNELETSENNNNLYISKKSESSIEYGQVYFMRKTGYQGSLVAFTAFIDGNLVCNLNNNKYSVHNLNSGKHEFAVQFAGKKIKNNTEIISIDVKAGKTYYVKMILKHGLVNNLYSQEVTERQGKDFLIYLKNDTKCL